jgi:hypothetical protein
MARTSHQRVKSLLAGQPVDRVPLRETFWSETLATWVQQGYPTRTVYKNAGQKHWCSSDGRWVETNQPGEYMEPIPPYQHFGFDMGEMDFLIDFEPLIGYKETIEETDDWEMYRNGAGGIMKYWKKKSGTPEHVDFRMTSRQIWENEYRPHLLEVNPHRIESQEIKPRLREIEQHQKFSTHNHGFVWEWMRYCMGDLTLYTTLLDDPGWVHDFCRVYTDFYKSHYTYFFEKIGNVDGIYICEDLAYKTNLFASPQTYQDLIFPYYRELIDFYHDHGVLALFHCDGAVKKILPMLADLGIDAFNPVEAKAIDNDIFSFAEQHGNKIGFIGGVDARVFETNDKGVIQQAVADFMEGMKSREARFVFASDHSISPLVQYDSYRYALDTYHQYMWY